MRNGLIALCCGTCWRMLRCKTFGDSFCRQTAATNQRAQAPPAGCSWRRPAVLWLLLPTPRPPVSRWVACSQWSREISTSSCQLHLSDNTAWLALQIVRTRGLSFAGSRLADGQTALSPARQALQLAPEVVPLLAQHRGCRLLQELALLAAAVLAEARAPPRLAVPEDLSWSSDHISARYPVCTHAAAGWQWRPGCARRRRCRFVHRLGTAGAWAGRCPAMLIKLHRFAALPVAVSAGSVYCRVAPGTATGCQPGREACRSSGTCKAAGRAGARV